MLRASHAMLKSYKECPQRYKFIYIDKLQDKFKQPKAEFTLGGHMHTTLKKLLKDIPKEERTAQRAKLLLRQVWTSNRAGFASPEDEKKYGQRALAMIDTFLESALVPRPIMLEQPVQFIIADDLMLYGRLDRVDEDSSGAVHLIDYKTGSFNPMFIDKSQLLLYSVLVAKGLELPIVSASFWYLEQNEFISYYPTETDLEQIVEEVVRTAERITSDGVFPATPSHVCKWCEFVDICPLRAEAMAIRDGVLESEEE